MLKVLIDILLADLEGDHVRHAELLEHLHELLAVDHIDDDQ